MYKKIFQEEGKTMKQLIFKSRVVWVIFLLLSFLVATIPAYAQEEDPPEIVLGERLFLETRFAQFFFANNSGLNNLLNTGDPVLDEVDDPLGILPPNSAGPFAGFSMNCRACHFVDELLEEDGNGMRTYTDYSRRSRVPARDDGQTTAARNSPPLVASSLFNLNHFDAEFDTMADLVKATLTGRNYGWLATEGNAAFVHIVDVIRTDDGSEPFAGEDFVGESYTDALNNPALGALGLDVTTANDEEVFHAVANLISAYVNDLGFSQDDNGEFNLSPYDAFLTQNGLDRSPAPGESSLEYSQRLLDEINALESPIFISGDAPGPFKFHNQGFIFDQEELNGLRIFFAKATGNNFNLRDDNDEDVDNEDGEEDGENDDGDENPSNGQEVGNCITCHSAPNFTDLNFHNTGTTQDEYDDIHGEKKFNRIRIPLLRQRLAQPNRFLPATSQHPEAKGIFRSVPSSDNKRLTDLGLWNIFANPDFPNPQRKIWTTLCEKRIGEPFEVYDLITNKRLRNKVFRKCAISELLPASIALFKTPGLRDLGHSAPFMHTGQFDTLDSIIDFYIESSDLARSGKLRNGAPELKDIQLTDSDIVPLVKFLKSLNEDYE
jgi:hypothetical protein